MEKVTIAGYPGIRQLADNPAPHPVVFLHGAWETHACFSNWIEYFAERGWSSYALSRRGRLGLPPRDCAGISMGDYLEDTLRVLDVIPGEPVIVGHSMGGFLAQLLAARGRSAAAVMLEPAPPKGIRVSPRPSAWPVFLRLAPRIIAGLPFLPSERDMIATWLNAMPLNEAKELYRGFIPESGKTFRQALLGYPIDHTKVTCPMLCLAGLESPSITIEVLRKVAARYKADLVELPGHSHWLMREPGWEDLAETVVRWLDDKLRSTAEGHDTKRPPAAADGLMVG